MKPNRRRISAGVLCQRIHHLSGSRPRTLPGQTALMDHPRMAALPNILRSESSTVSVLARNSRKIRRVVRSSLGAECAAFSTGLEHTDMFRKLHGTLCGDLCDLAEYENYIQATDVLCVKDCKSLANAFLAASAAVSRTSEDKRLGIELSMIKQRLSRNETRFQLVEGTTMPADGPTKRKERGRASQDAAAHCPISDSCCLRDVDGKTASS